jgi:hypothetical protein
MSVTTVSTAVRKCTDFEMKVYDACRNIPKGKDYDGKFLYAGCCNIDDTGIFDR